MNNKYLKIALIIFIIQAFMLITTETVTAQRMRMSVDERVKLLTEQLSLTKVQADSVRKIYLELDTLRTKLFNTNQGDRSEMREIMRKIQDSTDARIDSLLTKEQREKFVEIKKQRLQRMGPPPGRRPDMN